MLRGIGRAALLAAIAVPAGSIASCAGSSQERLSSKALAAKGDAICENLRHKLTAADEAAGTYTLPHRVKLSELFSAAEERASDQLERLKPEASAEAEWHRVIAARRGLIAYHRRIIKYASLGKLDQVEATYKAYKAAQWQMQLGFKHSRFPFKICWDIG